MHAVTSRYFRYFLASHQIGLLAYFLIDAWSWFGYGQMVLIRTPHFPTLLDLINNNVWLINIFIMLTIALWSLFAFDLLNRKLQILLFIFSLSLHNANPYIIHEPQQIANLLLFIQIFFLPADAKTFIDKKIILILTIALGVYYLTAGLKKMPDPLWQNGDALGFIISWPPFSNFSTIVNEITNHKFLMQFLNWFTLIFEISFLPLLFTRWRDGLFFIGFLFHLGIFLAMEVGTFSYIMLSWYALVFPIDKYILILRQLLQKKKLLK